ncbi:MAG: hypothetical protein WCD18_12095 [Thermosynechococcaceae cyanobacterium]
MSNGKHNGTIGHRFRIGLGLFSMGLGLSQGLLLGNLSADAVPLQVALQGQPVQLYGEVAIADQLGKTYLLFTQTGTQVVGAIYHPQSEYSCFTGQQTGNRLDLKLLEQDNSASNNLQISLPSLHALASIGPSERQTLAACQKEALAL